MDQNNAVYRVSITVFSVSLIATALILGRRAENVTASLLRRGSGGNCSSDFLFGPSNPFELAAVPRDENSTSISLRAVAMDDYLPINKKVRTAPPRSYYSSGLVLEPSTAWNSRAGLLGTVFAYNDGKVITNRTVSGNSTIYQSMFFSPSSHKLRFGMTPDAASFLEQQVVGPCDAERGTVNYLVETGRGSESWIGLYQWSLSRHNTSFSWGCPEWCIPVALKIVPIPGTF